MFLSLGTLTQADQPYFLLSLTMEKHPNLPKITSSMKHYLPKELIVETNGIPAQASSTKSLNSQY